ncbi:MAG: recombination-associated protein RdgC [Desulfovibrio sp.]|nr:recombination-associated protein RdgC [Desulfovibrio sp.]
MGILSASTGLTRYRIMDDVSNELLRDVPRLLRQYHFLDIDDSAEERSFGWTNVDDMLDVDWNQSPPEKGHYMAFSLRLETRRVQPAVFKKHFQIALNKELAQAKEQGKNFVSRARKQELKEQVMLRLRARSLPIPATFDVAWNTQNHRIFLDTTNAKACALFEDHFYNTFELRLEPLTPFFLAMDHLGEDAARTLEDLEPSIFI